MNAGARITIAIPTYRREAVLVNTLMALLDLDKPAAEIIVLDQSEQHQFDTDKSLRALADRARIRWLRLREPSITKAMNRGLLEATQPIVLFVDDDILPEPGLVEAHLAGHEAQADALLAGKVLQPWNEGRDYLGDTQFHFAVDKPQEIREFMGGNFSLRRASALALGGFDENFVRGAYRFEAEFAHRWLASGRRIHFEPAACLHHLKVGDGGTRSYGDHLSTWRPDHAVGAYYHALRTGRRREFLTRPLRALTTRYHLRHPWAIPTTLLAELGGILWALRLFLNGPRLIDAGTERRCT
jgi:GT2 family glycosyltransferase